MSNGIPSEVIERVKNRVRSGGLQVEERCSHLKYTYRYSLEGRSEQIARVYHKRELKKSLFVEGSFCKIIYKHTRKKGNTAYIDIRSVHQDLEYLLVDLEGEDDLFVLPVAAMRKQFPDGVVVLRPYMSRRGGNVTFPTSPHNVEYCRASTNGLHLFKTTLPVQYELELT